MQQFFCSVYGFRNVSEDAKTSELSFLILQKSAVAVASKKCLYSRSQLLLLLPKNVDLVEVSCCCLQLSKPAFFSCGRERESILQLRPTWQRENTSLLLFFLDLGFAFFCFAILFCFAIFFALQTQFERRKGRRHLT